jgi:hypothetical protein
MKRLMFIATLVCLTFTSQVPAQSATVDGQEQRSSYRSSRGTKGVIKLIGLGAICVVGAGGWVLKKIRGE